MLYQSCKTSGNRDRVSGFLRLFVLSLLTAVFGFTTLHAQTVAYTANTSSNTVSVIDTSTNMVTATIPVGNLPIGVTFSSDGTLAYVTNTGDGTISVINTATNAVTTTITLQAPATPRFMALTPDGKSLYVTDFEGNVQVVSTATNTVTAFIPTGSLFPSAIAITPDGSRVYVQDFLAVTVIATATNTVVAQIPLLISAIGPSIAVTPSGNNVYVCGGAAPDVNVLATVNNTLVTSIPTPDGPSGLAIAPDGSSVFVGDQEAGLVSVINTSTNTTSAVIGPFVGPTGVAFTPDGAFVYVTNTFSNTVSVIDTSTNAVVANIVVGNNPFGIAIANLTTPFAVFAIDNLNISPQGFHEQGDFTLGAKSTGIDLAHQPVTLTIGSFSLTIPAGSFRQVGGNLHFVFNGTINGLQVSFNLKAVNGSSTQFTYVVNVNGVDLTSQPDPATVGLKIGNNTGTATVEF